MEEDDGGRKGGGNSKSTLLKGNCGKKVVGVGYLGTAGNEGGGA